MQNLGNNLFHIIYSLKSVAIPPSASVVCELLFTKHDMFTSIILDDELSFMLNHMCCA